jgi:steroid delta-isomerase-like uncharacterized protein
MPGDGTKIAHAYFERLMSSPGDLHVADEILAPDVLFHPPITPEPVAGIEAFKEFAQHWYVGFPDRVFTMGDTVEEGDKVAALFTITGTHNGPFLGTPPTGNKIMVNGVNLFTFEQGRIKDIRVFFNPQELYGPLGIKT